MQVQGKKKMRIGMQHIMGHICSYTYMSLVNWLKKKANWQHISPYIYVPILLTICPYTTTCVSSNSCVTRPASLGLYVSSCYYMCPHTTICVLILLHMRPASLGLHHSAYICVFSLYMCPHTTIYVSSYSWTHMRPASLG